jgi:hypothetical protein
MHAVLGRILAVTLSCCIAACAGTSSDAPRTASPADDLDVVLPNDVAPPIAPTPRQLDESLTMRELEEQSRPRPATPPPVATEDLAPAIVDPTRPKPPQDLATRAPLPPIDEPIASPLERRDLMQRYRAPTPLEGLYELRSIQRPGVGGAVSAKGYLAIGARHLVLHVHVVESSPLRPFLQSGARTYRIVGNQLQMTTIVGHHNDADGNIHIERTGSTESRTFTLQGPILRIHHGASAWYEFLRIE